MNLDLTLEESLGPNIDYLQMITEVDVRHVDDVKRDPDGVRQLIASYARNVSTSAALRTVGILDRIGWRDRHVNCRAPSVAGRVCRFEVAGVVSASRRSEVILIGDLVDRIADDIGHGAEMDLQRFHDAFAGHT